MLRYIGDPHDLRRLVDLIREVSSRELSDVHVASEKAQSDSSRRTIRSHETRLQISLSGERCHRFAHDGIATVVRLGPSKLYV